MFAKLTGIGTAAMLCIAAVPALTFAQSIVPGGGSGQSGNWAGYVAEGQEYNGVGGTWIVPSVTPSSTSSGLSADATWVGIGGVEQNDLLQAGTQAIVQGGQVTYEAWYEALPQTQVQLPVTLNAGDSVTVSVVESSSGVWKISFTDLTSGAQYETSVEYSSSHSSAEWIEEMPLGIEGGSFGFVPLDSFGAVQFSNAYALVAGARETPQAAGAQSLTMITQQGQTLATTSALASDGESFSVSRTDASSSSSVSFGTGIGRSWGRHGDGVQSYSPHRRQIVVQTTQPSSASAPTSEQIVIPPQQFQQIEQLQAQLQALMQSIRVEFMLER